MSLTNGKVHDGAVHVSIASTGESVDVTEEDEQAIVIIQEEQLESSEIDSSFPTHIISNEVRANVCCALRCWVQVKAAVPYQALLYIRSQCGICDTDVCCCQAFRQGHSKICLSVHEGHCCLAEWQTLAVAVIKKK